jgi:peptide-methionine (S)-S-oxide reductase
LCTEAVFLELEGVHAVISGYIGVKQLILPIRKYVMEIRDAEAIEITFDPAKIGSEIFGDLLHTIRLR